MRILALLHDLRARSALQSSLAPHRIGASRPTLEFSQSWPMVLAAARTHSPEIVVVNPWDEGAASAAYLNLSRLLDSMDRDRIVLFLPQGEHQAEVLEEVQGWGFRWIVIEGLSEGRTAFQQMLGLASACVLVGEIGLRIRHPLGRARTECVVESLAGSLDSQTVDDLAVKLAMTPTTLRAALRRHAMPPPREILRWGRLCHALGLRRIGVTTTTVVAHLVGYEDPASLCRLFRDLLACPSNELIEGQEHRILADRLLKRVAVG